MALDIKALKHAYVAGYKTSVSMEPMLAGYMDAVCVYKTVAPLVTETVWIGLMNKLDERVDRSVEANKKTHWLSNPNKGCYMARKLKILIFDDDPAVLEAVSSLVESLGHEVLGFSDPTLCPLYSDDGCRCTKDSTCADLLITDNNMPRMTGLEFIGQQILRGCKGVAETKAVMSGAWSEQDLLLARSLGCKIFTKPPNIEELIAWIKERELDILNNLRIN